MDIPQLRGLGPCARTLFKVCLTKDLPFPEVSINRLSNGFGATVNFSTGLARTLMVHRTAEEAKEEAAHQALLKLCVNNEALQEKEENSAISTAMEDQSHKLVTIDKESELPNKDSDELITVDRQEKHSSNRPKNPVNNPLTACIEQEAGKHHEVLRVTEVKKELQKPLIFKDISVTNDGVHYEKVKKENVDEKDQLQIEDTDFENIDPDDKYDNETELWRGSINTASKSIELRNVPSVTQNTLVKAKVKHQPNFETDEMVFERLAMFLPDSVNSWLLELPVAEQEESAPHPFICRFCRFECDGGWEDLKSHVRQKHARQLKRDRFVEGEEPLDEEIVKKKFVIKNSSVSASISEDNTGSNVSKGIVIDAIKETKTYYELRTGQCICTKEDCQRLTENRESAEEHWQACHGRIRLLRCNICDSWFEGKSLLFKHHNSKHRSKFGKTPQYSFAKCTINDETYKAATFKVKQQDSTSQG